MARDDGGAAKRAHDGDLSEEADARGWSSSVPERSGSPTRRSGWVAATDASDELGEEPGTADAAVGEGIAAEEADWAETCCLGCFDCFDYIDRSGYLTGLDLSWIVTAYDLACVVFTSSSLAIETDRDSGLIILEAQGTRDVLGSGFATDEGETEFYYFYIA